MLSSPQDGEVLAAARALVRTLQVAGTDVHELAERVEGRKLSEAEMRTIYDAAYREGRSAAEADKAFSQVGPNWHDMAVDCRDHDDGRLTPREREFVDDMVRWTLHREPSEKQAKWLHVLYVQLGKRQR